MANFLTSSFLDFGKTLAICRSSAEWPCKVVDSSASSAIAHAIAAESRIISEDEMRIRVADQKFNAMCPKLLTDKTDNLRKLSTNCMALRPIGVFWPDHLPQRLWIAKVVTLRFMLRSPAWAYNRHLYRFEHVGPTLVVFRKYDQRGQRQSDKDIRLRRTTEAAYSISLSAEPASYFNARD